jgi:hypothetical protein
MAKHEIRFFPLGNADTTLITLSNGKQILWDYANMKDQNDDKDKRCDLPKELDKVVNGNYDVVTFTHADNDHIKGFSEYFYLNHAIKYQSLERKKIKELWVPASVLLDTHAEDEAKTLKSEARYRLKQKSGILVFSKPSKMKKWCDDQEDISFEEVKHLFVDAGKTVPSLNLKNDGIEIFVHSPFKSESKNIDRNSECIVVQAVFDDSCSTKLILGADLTQKVWSDVVTITKSFGRASRLEWDFFHISHHSSYKSLNEEEKGQDKTEPVEEIKWLFEDQGNSNGRMISSSWSIPTKGSKEDNEQPPHRQAAAYYKDVSKKNNGEYLVTMEYPNETKPETIVVEIDKSNCAKVLKVVATGAAFIGAKPAPRAGQNG